MFALFMLEHGDLKDPRGAAVCGGSIYTCRGTSLACGFVCMYALGRGRDDNNPMTLHDLHTPFCS